MARPKAFDEQEVLGKAMELFWRKGYNATSMQDLVDELGINRASLYSTYGGKQSLYEKALQQYRQDTGKMMQSLIESDLSAKELIQKLLESAATESLEDATRKGCFVVNAAVELAPHQPEIDRMVRDNMEGFVETFSEVFRKGQENGEIPQDKDPVALARYFFNTFNGLRVMAKTQPNADLLKDIIDTSLYVLEA